MRQAGLPSTCTPSQTTVPPRPIPLHSSQHQPSPPIERCWVLLNIKRVSNWVKDCLKHVTKSFSSPQRSHSATLTSLCRPSSTRPWTGGRGCCWSPPTPACTSPTPHPSESWRTMRRRRRMRTRMPTLGDLKFAGAGFPETSVSAIASPSWFFARHWYFPWRSTLPTCWKILFYRKKISFGFFSYVNILLQSPTCCRSRLCLLPLVCTTVFSGDSNPPFLYQLTFRNTSKH